MGFTHYYSSVLEFVAQFTFKHSSECLWIPSRYSPRKWALSKPCTSPNRKHPSSFFVCSSAFPQRVGIPLASTQAPAQWGEQQCLIYNQAAASIASCSTHTAMALRPSRSPQETTTSPPETTQAEANHGTCLHQLNWANYLVRQERSPHSIFQTICGISLSLSLFLLVFFTSSLTYAIC